MDNALEGEAGWSKALLKAENDFILTFISDCSQLLQKPRNFISLRRNFEFFSYFALWQQLTSYRLTCNRANMLSHIVVFPCSCMISLPSVMLYDMQSDIYVYVMMRHK